MYALDSQINTSSAEFSANKKAYSVHLESFFSARNRALQGGGEASVERHKSRGKLTARERIESLIDPGSEFLEFSTLAAHDMYEGSAPGALKSMMDGMQNMSPEAMEQIQQQMQQQMQQAN